MQIIYGRNFKKMFKKQSKKVQEQFCDRLVLFMNNKQSPLLNIHSLNGEWIGCHSINITGDIRAIYEEEDNFVEFIAIGSHSELYS